MRDRLIELFEKALDEYGKNNFPCFVSNYLADYLLANGVIVPPCKVGDTVYETMLCKFGKGGFVRQHEVVGFHLGYFPTLRGTQRKQYLVCFSTELNRIYHVSLDNLGKTVFLTREEAERELKGGANND